MARWFHDVDHSRDAVRHAAQVARDLAEFGPPPGESEEVSQDELGGGTIAELRAYAAAHSLGLGGATARGDIEDVVFDHVTVAQLQAHARENGVDLTGATRRADIIARLRGDVTEPATEAEKSWPVGHSGNIY